MNRRVWIGADIGGTAVKGAVVDEQGHVRSSRRYATFTGEGGAGLLRQLALVVAELLAEAPDVCGIGVGTAGRVDPEAGKILYATGNLPGWSGVELASELQSRFRLPVTALNDANAAAVGEGWIGAAAGLNNYVMLTLGTGVGGAAVMNSRLVTGVNGGAGEFGHMILHPGGHLCNCGNHGCLEQYVSGTALGRIAEACGSGRDAHALISAAARGDRRAEQALGRFTDDLSIALANLQSAFDPEAFILGGGVSDEFELWGPELVRKLETACGRKPDLRAAKLGNAAGMVGAARMIMNKEAKVV